MTPKGRRGQGSMGSLEIMLGAFGRSLERLSVVRRNWRLCVSDGI
jgi:hypothetical protein